MNSDKDLHILCSGNMHVLITETGHCVNEYSYHLKSRNISVSFYEFEFTRRVLGSAALNSL